MRYIDVEWIQDSEDYPNRLVSEIADDNFETRKLEFFANGSVGYASEKGSTKDTELGTCEVPSLGEINSQDEFSGQSITRDEFEKMWQKYVHGIA
ncbi:DUF6881 domain-containing protein [Microbulbifer aggregans]|uniref:DUF6881 domain-containing protein n=1 Tax=Microbulbifer aggregans TaxID=1769779 RepID=UPI001CFE9594|nr:hypothetical protein [Microbulbifer aggregans]